MGPTANLRLRLLEKAVGGQLRPPPPVAVEKQVKYCESNWSAEQTRRITKAKINEWLWSCLEGGFLHILS